MNSATNTTSLQIFCPECDEHPEKGLTWLIENPEAICIRGHRINLRSEELVSRITKLEEMCAKLDRRPIRELAHFGNRPVGRL